MLTRSPLGETMDNGETKRIVEYEPIETEEPAPVEETPEVVDEPAPV